uniref:Polyprenol reductase n=1 Tax=Mesocestoides corti TaxID=53468 RepID=A0A5K3F7K5_MESCO
ARATRQAPSIRVHHAGHAAHYILLLSHVLLWLAAYLSRMTLEHREAQDWLRLGGPICLRPDPTPQSYKERRGQLLFFTFLWLTHAVHLSKAMIG